MSEKTNVDQIESSENVESNIINFSTRVAEQTIEQALDVIYEQLNGMHPKIHEWIHSIDKINISNN